MFQEVRFEQIPSRYLTKEIIPSLCEKYSICVERVRDALEKQAASGENVRASKSDFARKPHDVIYVISCRTNLVERFDNVKCACVRCPEMTPTGPVESLKENRCGVVVGQDLYCVSNTKVDKFSILELCWTEVGEGKKPDVLSWYIYHGISHESLLHQENTSNKWDIPSVTTREPVYIL